MRASSVPHQLRLTRPWPALLFGLGLLALSPIARSQANNAGIAIPVYNDAYSKQVRQLESGDTNIDYRAFRESFLDSEQFKIAANQMTELDKLRKEMHELMAQSSYAEIVKIAKKILSVDYTDMEAHKILQQSYKALGDAAGQKKYHDIEFGLLNSIVKNGDGKTPETAWPVIQITEEYFILNMLGAKLLKQSIDNHGGVFDRMDVETDQGKKTYYFEISKVFKGYSKQGLH